MNPTGLRYCLVICSIIGGVRASDISPERMRAVYEEAGTPHKCGIVIPSPEGKKVDCPTVFRHGDRWYTVCVQLENDPAGYTTQLAVSDNLLHWQAKGMILACGDGDTWDKANAAGGIALVNTQWGGDGMLWTRWEGPHLLEPSEPWDAEFAHRPWLLKHEGVVCHSYCAVGNQGRAIALATSRPMRITVARETQAEFIDSRVE